MNFLKRFWIAVHVVWRWDQAAEKGAKGQYDAALQEIRAAEKIGIPLEPRFLLLKAVLARQIGDPTLAFQSVVEAHRQIKSYRRYSDAEIKYLQCYASILGLKIAQEQNLAADYDFCVDYASVDLNKVWGPSKKVFPLRGHPAWKV